LDPNTLFYIPTGVGLTNGTLQLESAVALLRRAEALPADSVGTSMWMACSTLCRRSSWPCQPQSLRPFGVP